MAKALFYTFEIVDSAGTVTKKNLRTQFDPNAAKEFLIRQQRKGYLPPGEIKNFAQTTNPTLPTGTTEAAIVDDEGKIIGKKQVPVSDVLGITTPKK